MSFDHSDEYEFTTSNTSFKPFAAIKHNGFTIPANSKIKVKPIFHWFHFPSQPQHCHIGIETNTGNT